MPITETTRRGRVAPPSSLRTELNIAAAIVAVALCIVLLALLANTQVPRAAHHVRAHPHVAAARTATAAVPLGPP